MTGYVYIMASKQNGTLYLGVTSNIEQRVFEHREGLIEGFTRRYGCKRLVWYEEHEDIGSAIQREKTLKHWYRKWKLKLIESMNPDWDDLYETFG